MVEYVGSQQDFMKIPVLGLVPESNSTAPSSPVAGQLWNDTTNNLLKRWDGSAWVVVGATPADASTTVKGIVELATDAETNTGTDTVRALTPSNLAANFTNRLDTDTSLAANSDAKIATQKATKAYVDSIVAASDAMVFKGVIDCSASPNYPAANRGDTYRVSVAGKIGGGSGVNVEVGDLLICLTDGTASGNQATVGSAWTITQTNIDGAVTGPASSTSGNLASFNGAGGKTIQDTGVAVSTDGTFASNSDAKVPTEKAVKTYAQPLDTDLSAIAALTSAANKMPYATAAGTWALADLTSLARSFINQTTASGARQAISAAGVATGTVGALTAGTPTTITHNLGTSGVVAHFKITSSGDPIRLAWKPNATNPTTQIDITSDVAFSSGAITFAVVG